MSGYPYPKLTLCLYFLNFSSSNSHRGVRCEDCRPALHRHSDDVYHLGDSEDLTLDDHNTHALFSNEKIRFKNHALMMVDETSSPAITH
ncbi:uncharacterized protein An16g04300 [Aspergillus niger]|uniref:Contig An16c0160, genomic contig n=2 Tax=Aspergillus niger TaxID=5061 RepID=A2R7P9_ASPNC|nr:uncharacterized protein An16g04300 [Aspergillus niger]CAK46847.1 unnamed protein product [Aspergillus niger]